MSTTAAAAKSKPVKPKKPKDFPLTPHPRGSWCKKIDGKVHYFGPWSDPAAALEAWEQFDCDRKAGKPMRPRRDGRLTVKDMTNAFLTAQNDRVEQGGLKLRSYRELKPVLEDFARSVGITARVADLAAADFTRYRASLLKKKNGDDRLGSHSVKRHTTIVRTCFRWAFEEDLIEKLPKYGSDFGQVRGLGISATKPLMFTPDEIRTMVNAATAPLRAMILLGINCGFGNTDVGTLPIAAVDLDAGFIAFPRTKTGISRRCPLWPETIDAIRESLAVRRRPIEPEDADVLFVTRGGRPFTGNTAIKKDGLIVDVRITDSLAGCFKKLLGECGIRKVSKAGNAISDGRGSFYSLRRTFRTIADEMMDDHAANVIMGHTAKSMGEKYVQRIGDERLRRLVDHVRSKIFPAT
jgi:integrase